MLKRQQKSVIGGYRPAGDNVDALLAGYFENKKLRFAANVRASLVPHVRRELARVLDDITFN